MIIFKLLVSNIFYTKTTEIISSEIVTHYGHNFHLFRFTSEWEGRQLKKDKSFKVT